MKDINKPSVENYEKYLESGKEAMKALSVQRTSFGKKPDGTPMTRPIDTDSALQIMKYAYPSNVVDNVSKQGLKEGLYYDAMMANREQQGLSKKPATSSKKPATASKKPATAAPVAAPVAAPTNTRRGVKRDASGQPKGPFGGRTRRGRHNKRRTRKNRKSRKGKYSKRF
jgi:hypothetical protein